MSSTPFHARLKPFSRRTRLAPVPGLQCPWIRPGSPVSRLRSGPWFIDSRADLVQGPRGSVRLAPKAMAVLARLLSTPGEMVRKEDLLRRVWPDSEVGEQVLTTAIYNLRRAFAATADERAPLETVPRRGYVFTAEVESLAPRPPLAGAPAGAAGVPGT
ncbi:MAG: hypothetical protein F9K18_03215, partial [Thermoanaerobaculia bacterium]